MSNQHGYMCPACKSPDTLFITTTFTVQGLLMEDGIDFDCHGDFDFDETNPARCECGWSGKVADLEEELSPAESKTRDELDWGDHQYHQMKDEGLL